MGLAHLSKTARPAWTRRQAGPFSHLIPLLIAIALSAPALADPPPRMIAAAFNEDETGSGQVVGIRAVSPWDQLKGPLPVGADATLRSAFGRVYAVSKSEDSVTVIDVATWSVEQVIDTGVGSQPIDIAVVDANTAYVSRRGDTHLLRVDLNSWATEAVVDLSPLADVDGIPEMAWMAIHNGKLFVQLERFNDGEPYGFIPPATLAVVDLASEQLLDLDPLKEGLQGLELLGTAAKHKMQILPGTSTLYLSASGQFFDSGGLESVNLDTLQSNGLILEETVGEIGADLGCFVFTSPTKGYLVFSTDLIESTHLVDFNDAAKVGPEIISIVAYRAPTLLHEIASDTIFLPQGVNKANGLHVFAAADGTQLTANPVPLAGTPTDIAFVCDASNVCGDEACPAQPSCIAVPALGPGAAGLAALVLLSTAILRLVGTGRARVPDAR